MFCEYSSVIVLVSDYHFALVSYHRVIGRKCFSPGVQPCTFKGKLDEIPGGLFDIWVFVDISSPREMLQMLLNGLTYT